LIAGITPFKYTGSHTRELGDAGDENLSKRQKELLEE